MDTDHRLTPHPVQYTRRCASLRASECEPLFSGTVPGLILDTQERNSSNFINIGGMNGQHKVTSENSEIISYWGYIYAEYEVVTQDGYIVPIYRIPRGKNESGNLVPKPAVYLQHGWALSASIWRVNPPSSSLGFFLADAGFEVWLGNSRGNTYARKHVHLDPDSKEFWAFSYDQHIKYDLPATTDFVVNITGQEQIYYVGHSQGTLLAFGAFAINPQLAQKIKKIFLLGPVATVKYISGLVRTIAYMGTTMTKNVHWKCTLPSLVRFDDTRAVMLTMAVIGPLSVGVESTRRANIWSICAAHWQPHEQALQRRSSKAFVLFGEKDIFCSSDAKYLVQFLCQRKIIGPVCNNLLTLLFGYNPKNINEPTPPLYKVKDMKVPTAMWRGGRDFLAHPTDVKKLEPNISNLVYHKKIADYSHMDFVIGIR
ncbi:tear acid lipase-like protein [Rattus rattus]|uniref:tear acid lipase-like protein n=1 Tax=Rattus rattus TaxID=10117 RepID=UPI0013F394F9|nr:tear acid lipase-like protein [Rattus rattus]